MQRGGTIAGAAAILSMIGCGGEQGKLQIRSLPTALAPGERAISFRVAEANGQFALGNVALALEGYRKAMREDPRSIEAITGIAACYARMGRFDLSRRHYEAALAIRPSDARLLAALASSLDLQGLQSEAAAVRGEIAARVAEAATVPTAPVPEVAAPPPPTIASASPPANERGAVSKPGPVELAVAVTPDAARPIERAVAAPDVAQPPAAGRSVTIKLPAPTPAIELKEFKRVAPEAGPSVRPAVEQQAAKRPGPRIERMSLTEVALITTAQPQWRAVTVNRTHASQTIRFIPLRQAQARPPQVRILNAARVHRLAARTRDYLTGRGWRGISIGDASQMRARSLIVYPVGRQAAAARLAAQFGFPMAPRAGVRQLTILVGRDANALPALRARAL